MSESIEKKEGAASLLEDEFVEVSLDDETLIKEESLINDKKEKVDEISSDDKYSDKVDQVKNILSGIPVRPKMRLMTFKELQEKIGRKPLPDKFGGLVKMSERYKAVGTELEKLQTRLGDAKVHEVADEDSRKQFAQGIDKQLNAITQKANAYMDGHLGDKKVIEAVEALLDEIDQFRKSMPKMLEALYQEKLGDYPKDLEPEQVVIASKYDIPLEALKRVSGKHCNFTALNDSRLSAPVKPLDKGACNEVQLVTHDGVDRVFKKEKQSDEGTSGPAGRMGIDRNDPRYGNRNVAGGVIGRLLGTKVMPQCSFGISKGAVDTGKSKGLFAKKQEPKNELGLVMEKAPGVTAASFIDKLNYGTVTLSPKAIANLQEQLAELEVCDLITCQGDRHGNNYMIDVKGDAVTLTGIDNDFSFPDPTKSSFEAGEIPVKSRGMHTLHKLPKLIGKAIADKIRLINFDRDIAPDLEGLLSKDEIAATKDRLLDLQNHIEKLDQDGCIVADWEKWRSKDDETASQYLAKEPLMRNNMFLRDFALPLGVTTTEGKKWGYPELGLE
jgi:hypothetical protein